MKIFNVRGLMETVATKARRTYSAVSETIGNKLVRNPKTDLLVTKKLTPDSVKTVEDARAYLKGLTQEDKTPKFKPDDIDFIMEYIQTPEQARMVAEATELGISPLGARTIASSIEKPENFGFKLDYTRKFSKLLGDDNSTSFSSVVAEAKTPEQAKFQYELAKTLVGPYKGSEITIITILAKIKEQAQLAEYMAKNGFMPHDIASLIIHADTPKKVEFASRELKNGVSPLHIGSDLSWVATE